MKNHSYLSMQQDTPDQGRLQKVVAARLTG